MPPEIESQTGWRRCCISEDAEGMEALNCLHRMEDAAGSISRGLTLTLTDGGGKKTRKPM